MTPIRMGRDRVPRLGVSAAVVSTPTARPHSDMRPHTCPFRWFRWLRRCHLKHHRWSRPARNNQESMALNKIVAKCESDPVFMAWDYGAAASISKHSGSWSHPSAMIGVRCCRVRHYRVTNLSVFAEGAKALRALVFGLRMPCDDAIGHDQTAIQHFMFVARYGQIPSSHKLGPRSDTNSKQSCDLHVVSGYCNAGPSRIIYVDILLAMIYVKMSRNN